VLALIALALTIGLADSINPSTIAPALYIATTRDAERSLVAFVLGVFLVYLAGGVVLTLGPGRALVAELPHPNAETKHWLELALGLAALLVAALLWRVRERVAASFRRAESRLGRSSFLVGAGIMAVELPTAFPYFAVIAALVGADVSVVAEIVLLVLFNVAFVAPLLVIVAIRRVLGPRAQATLERFRDAVAERAGAIIPAIVLVVAVALLVVGGVGVAEDH
jgi:cytochrome c biogenesis protein CcdA